MRRDRIRKVYKNWAAAVLAAMLTLIAAGTAGAAEAAIAYPQMDASKAVTLKVHAASDGTAIEGLRFTLYKIADMSVSESGAVSFELAKTFVDAYGDSVELNLDPNDLDSSGWADGAKNLAPHVLADSKSGKHSFEMESAATGADGSASFTGLAQGLYLMVNNYEGSAYTSVEATPVFITLPMISEDGSAWEYDASVNAKVTAAVMTEEKTSVTAVKVWSGDDTAGTSSRRPASVTVDLIDGNGAVKDTQELNASNGWKVTWEGLPAGNWSVVEKDVPANYSVSQSEAANEDGSGKTVTITNTTPPAGVQGESREKTTDSKKKSKVKGSSRQGDTAAVASAARLPQTGQLWWPVWLLAGIAAALVIAGLILRLSGKRDLKD